MKFASAAIAGTRPSTVRAPPGSNQRGQFLNYRFLRISGRLNAASGRALSQMQPPEVKCAVPVKRVNGGPGPTAPKTRPNPTATVSTSLPGLTRRGTIARRRKDVA